MIMTKKGPENIPPPNTMNKTKRNNGLPDTPNGFLHFFATVTRVNHSAGQFSQVEQFMS